FLGRTAHRNQCRREIIWVQARAVRILSTFTRVSGLLFSPLLFVATGVSPILPNTSSPRMSFPKLVYFPSRKEASPRQMKNWLPAESGSFDRAMEITPR